MSLSKINIFLQKISQNSDNIVFVDKFTQHNEHMCKAALSWCQDSQFFPAHKSDRTHI